VPLHQHWGGRGLGSAAEGAASSGPAAQVLEGYRAHDKQVLEGHGQSRAAHRQILEGREQTEARARTQQAFGVSGKGPLLASLEVQTAVGAAPLSALLGGPRHWRGSAIIGLV
jgi:hypothetical protein